MMSAALRCDMERDCIDSVTHIDRKGFVYCEKHGARRKASGISCRVLRPAEVERLREGLTINWVSVRP